MVKHKNNIRLIKRPEEVGFEVGFVNFLRIWIMRITHLFIRRDSARKREKERATKCNPSATNKQNPKQER